MVDMVTSRSQFSLRCHENIRIEVIRITELSLGRSRIKKHALQFTDFASLFVQSCISVRRVTERSKKNHKVPAIMMGCSRYDHAAVTSLPQAPESWIHCWKPDETLRGGSRLPE